ncbi:MAG: carbohydrate ABC transporter permease [Ruminococcus sp.]|nr:carbohydrate ABC transporter permease [Ruminococcus sp.]
MRCSMQKIKTFIKYIFLIILALLFLFPLIYMLICSLMPSEEIAPMLDFSTETYKSIKLIPDTFTLEQFYQVFFRRSQYLLKFWNSVIITFPTVIGQVVVSSLAAFAFAKLKFPFRDKLFFVYIVLLILPLQVTLVPNYIVLDNLKLLNSFLSVILPGTFSAFGICLLRQCIKYIPDSSIEAARIDGASYFKIFTNIILPQIRGGLITLALLCFIDSWNAVEQPLIYFNDRAMYPLSIGLADIGNSDYGIIFACGVMFMIPPMLIYLYGERDIESPFTTSDKL